MTPTKRQARGPLATVTSARTYWRSITIGRLLVLVSVTRVAR